MSEQMKLDVIRAHLVFMRKLVKEYPHSREYRDMLYKMEQNEVDVINQIGRK